MFGVLDSDNMRPLQKVCQRSWKADQRQVERRQPKALQGLQKKVKNQSKIKLLSDIMTLQDIIKKNPLAMTREDVFAINYVSLLKSCSDSKKVKEGAESMTDIFICAKDRREQNPQNYAIWEETLKIDIAHATNGPMPPKRFATDCYFPRR
jgi:hypothetical protein